MVYGKFRELKKLEADQDGTCVSGITNRMVVASLPRSSTHSSVVVPGSSSPPPPWDRVSVAPSSIQLGSFYDQSGLFL